MGSLFLSSVVFFLNSLPLQESLEELKNAVDETTEYYTAHPLPDDREHSGKRHYRDQFRSRLEELSNHLLAPLADGSAPLVEANIELVHLAFSGLACVHVFEGPSAKIPAKLNQLFAVQTGNVTDFEKLSQLIQLAHALNLQLQTIGPAESEALSSLRRAASDFEVELQNLLFYTPTPECVQPKHRKAKSLSELIDSSHGFRSPQTRFNLTKYFLEQHLALHPNDEVRRLLFKIETTLNKLSKGQSSKIVSNRRLIDRQLAFFSDIASIEFESVGLPEDSVLRLELVQEVYDVYGASWEIVHPVQTFDNAKARLGKSQLERGFEAFSRFDSIGYPEIRLSFYRRDGRHSTRIAYIDARIKRNPESLEFYLGFQPEFFPLRHYANIDALRAELRRAWSEDWQSFHLFLEDHSTEKVIPDRIMGTTEKGDYGVVGLLFDQAREYHRRRVEALYVAPRHEARNDFQKKPILLDFDLRIRTIATRD